MRKYIRLVLFTEKLKWEAVKQLPACFYGLDFNEVWLFGTQTPRARAPSAGCLKGFPTLALLIF